MASLISADRPATRPGTTAPHVAAAVVGALVAVGISYALDALTGEAIIMPALVVVAAAAALAGTAAATIAAVVSALGVLPLVAGRGGGELVRWATFVLAAGLMVALGHLVDRLRRGRDELRGELDTARRRLGVALDISPDGFVLAEPLRDEAGTLTDLRLTYANPAATRLLADDAADLAGRRVSELVRRPLDRLPDLEAVLASGRPFAGEIRRGTDDGVVVYDATAVRVEDGLAIALRDVSARRRDDERTRLLADVAVVMDRDPEVEPRAQGLVDLLVERIADACRVDLAQPGGRLTLGAVAARDPAVAEVLRALPAAAPGEPLAQAVHAGDLRRLERLDAEVLEHLIPDPQARRSAADLDLGSGMLLPLVARGHPVAALLALRGAGRRPFDETDETLLRLLAGRAALAIDNARLFEEQRSIAQTLQASLLPAALPSVPGLELAARYRPAGEGLEVGGDFYDVLRGLGPEGGERWTAVVGDVVGKGAEAAAMTSLVRHTLRLGPRPVSPADALERVNGAVRAEERPGLFCTAAAVALDVHGDGSVGLCSSSAGHPSPLVVRAGGGVEALGGHGTLLGWLDDLALPEAPGRLADGDAVVLYTDGVIEARREGDFFGEQRLVDLLRELSGAPAPAIADAVSDAAVAHAGSRPPDDIAVLVAAARN